MRSRYSCQWHPLNARKTNDHVGPGLTLSGTPFTLMNGSTSIGLSVSGSGTTYTITFTGSTDISYGSLIDGEYTFSINHSDVSGISGFTTNQTFTFHRLYGDYLGTGTVTAADFR
jgi:hypothetical protein